MSLATSFLPNAHHLGVLDRFFLVPPHFLAQDHKRLFHEEKIPTDQYDGQGDENNRLKKIIGLKRPKKAELVGKQLHHQMK